MCEQIDRERVIPEREVRNGAGPGNDRAHDLEAGRIVHALGDATGFEVMRAIIARARAVPNLTLWDDTFTIDLLTHDGRCCGAVLGRSDGSRSLVWAKQIVLASGGA